MRLIPRDTRIDFIGKRVPAMILSAVVLAVSIGSLAVQQLALGVDFTGGVVMHVVFTDPVELGPVRATLSGIGYPHATVQYFGTSSDVRIRLAPQPGVDSGEVSNRILAALHGQWPGAEMRRVQFVGPQVGAELAKRGALALLYALIGVLIYVIFRFHWKLAVSAIAALVHNLLMVLGALSLFQIQFDLTVIAALLATIGYGINDTIVIFDRARENFRRMRKTSPEEVFNASINQTLARTLVLNLLVLLVLLALIFVGGDALFSFSIAMLIGVIGGTYSTIYVANALATWLDTTKEDLFPPREEEGEKPAR